MDMSTSVEKAPLERRLDFYSENKHALLALRYVLAREELSPTFDPVMGYHFPELEMEIGLSAEETHRLLDSLAELGLLIKHVGKRFPVCPYCNSFRIGLMSVCPKCKTADIVRKQLVEHVCGYLTPYKEGEICPLCKREITKKSVREIGVWLECKNCQTKFDEPMTSYVCQDCGKDIHVSDIKFSETSYYMLNKEHEEEIRKYAYVLFDLSDKLRENGFRIQFPAKVQGKSGLTHILDLLIVKEPNSWGLDLVMTSKPEYDDDASVLRFFAKAFDVEVKPLLLVIPKLSTRIRQLVSSYDISIIEAENTDALAEKLLNYLRSSS